MTPADLVIVVPMLGRAHRVRPLLNSIEFTAPGCRVLFMLTDGDTEVIAAVRAAGGEHVTLPPCRVGDYQRKINAGYRATVEPLIFCGADDLLFHPGWFAAAVAYLDGTAGVVGTNDLGSSRVMAGEHATHSLVTRTYADTFGTIDGGGGQILHEGYPHEFCDDELVATAKKRGAWRFAADSHVEHLHPNWGKAPTDRTYQRQAARMRTGRRLFKSREALWT